jgi:hypothetical protein
MHNNIVDDLTSVTLTASTTATGYTVINVQDERLKKTWMSDATTTQTITCEFNTFPQYPDSTTGTTYLQTEWSTTDSWISNGATALTVSNGLLHVNCDCYRTISTSSKNVIIRIRNTNASAETFMLKAPAVTLGATLDSVILSYNQWGTLNTVGPSDAYNILVTSYNINSHFDVDYSYVGTGAYNTLLPDNSENNFTLTPININTEMNGNLKCINFNNNCAYCSGTISDLTELDGFTIEFSALEKINVNFADNEKIIFKYGLDTSNGLYCISSTNTSSTYNLVFVTTAGTETVNNIVTLNSTTLKNVIITYTYSTKIYTITVDGITTTGTLTNQIIMPTGELFIGRYNATLNQFPGLIGKYKIWGRTLSDNEKLNEENNISYETENLSLVCDYNLDKNYKVNTAAIIGHNIKSSSKIKVQANDLNKFDAPPITEYFNYINSDKMLLRFLASTYIYKYWKITITGQGSIEIGRLWLSDYTTINPSSLDNFSIIKKRNDIVSFGRNRQKFSTPGITWRQFKLSFPRSSSEMINAIQNIFDTVGNHSSIIFCNLDTARNYSLVEPVYCVINNDLNFNHLSKVGMDWVYDLDLEEIL